MTNPSRCHTDPRTLNILYIYPTGVWHLLTANLGSTATMSFPTEEMFLSTVEALQTIADGSPYLARARRDTHQSTVSLSQALKWKCSYLLAKPRFTGPQVVRISGYFCVSQDFRTWNRATELPPSNYEMEKTPLPSLEKKKLCKWWILQLTLPISGVPPFPLRPRAIRTEPQVDVGVGIRLGQVVAETPPRCDRIPKSKLPSLIGALSLWQRFWSTVGPHGDVPSIPMNWCCHPSLSHAPEV